MLHICFFDSETLTRVKVLLVRLTKSNINLFLFIP